MCCLQKESVLPTSLLRLSVPALVFSLALGAQEPHLDTTGSEREAQPTLQVADPALASAPQNPLPHTQSAIKLGRRHYLRHCQSCHGYDGRALDNVDFEASDLTTPSLWLHGTSDGEVFMSIQKGAGHEMPPFEKQLSNIQIWQIVHYIRSIGPKDARPLIVVEDD